jgi:electron transport complex protein RnfD
MRLSSADRRPLIRRTTVRAMMCALLVAMIPGLLVQIWHFGAGVLIQLLLTVPAAWFAEAIVLRLRQRPVTKAIWDGSALVTAVLLAVSLPPLLPWHLTVYAAGFSILIGKHVYGGLGQNPFNPAMVGLAAVLVSAPQAMTLWPPSTHAGQVELATAASAIFRGVRPLDGATGPTFLSSDKTSWRIDREPPAREPHDASGSIAGSPWVSINLAYLMGGLWLWRARIIAVVIPASFLGMLALLACLGFLIEPGRFPPPQAHFLNGGTMLAAFFIATDPVSSAATATGRWFFGALIGLLVFLIRAFGVYPDGIAFAVLLANLSAPTIDYWCGHGRFGRLS